MSAYDEIDVMYDTPAHPARIVAPYYRLLMDCRAVGIWHPPGRTSAGSHKLIGRTIHYETSQGFPLDLTRPVAVKGALGEMLGFIKGATTQQEFEALGCKFWKPWATESGALGPIYGANWRRWQDSAGNVHDQLANVIRGLKERPFSRRHHVSAWKVDLLPDETQSPQANAEQGLMALAPCHMDFTFEVALVKPYGNFHSPHGPVWRHVCDEKEADGTCQKMLHMCVHMRSNDLPVGQPHNATGYYYLLKMVAQQTGMVVGNTKFYLDNAHIYTNQRDALEEHVQRFAQLNQLYAEGKLQGIPRVELKMADSIDDYTPEHFEFINCKSPFGSLNYPVEV